MASQTESASVNEPTASTVKPNPTSVPKKKKVAKNAPGNRSDPAWNYGTAVDGNNRVIKCSFCSHVIRGSIYRLKHHLAKTNKDVRPCNSVTEEVAIEMENQCNGIHVALINKTESQEAGQSCEDGKGKRVTRAAPSDNSQLYKRRCTQQTTINTHYKKCYKDAANNAIARVFYNNAIPFNVARSEEYKTMVQAIAQFGKGYEPPSYNDIRVKHLKEQVKLTNDLLVEHRAEWKRVGCSIMTDGWTDRRKRSILNFLVNSPKGTVFLKSIDASSISKTGDVIFKLLDEVVEDVGEQNVIQVVTDNAANCVLAGEKLMEKRKNLYWTPCAAHCIDLMLEDLMYPELQTFAIRILSLTCSSSGCERNWSAFEMVHTKRRNHLKTKTMNDVVFVMVNSRLAKKKKERKAREFADLVSDSEWVSGDENEIEDGNTNSIDVDENTDEEYGNPDFNGMEAEQCPIYEEIKGSGDEGSEAESDEDIGGEKGDGSGGDGVANENEDPKENECDSEDEEFVVNMNLYD